MEFPKAVLRRTGRPTYVAPQIRGLFEIIDFEGIPRTNNAEIRLCYSLTSFPEDPVENLMGEIHRFIDGVICRNYSDVDLLLPCQPEASDDARPEVDLGTVRARDGGVGIEHFSSRRPALVCSQDDFGRRGKPRKADIVVVPRKEGKRP